MWTCHLAVYISTRVLGEHSHASDSMSANLWRELANRLGKNGGVWYCLFSGSTVLAEDFGLNKSLIKVSRGKIVVCSPPLLTEQHQSDT